MKFIPLSAEDNIEHLEKLYPLSSFIFGQFAIFDISETIKRCVKKHDLKIKKNKEFFFFTLLNHEILSEKILDNINPLGYYHSEPPTHGIADE